MYSFYINQKEEIDILNDMLADGGGCSIAERANQYHIPLEIARKCDKEKVPKELIEFVKKSYTEKEKELELALSFHTDFWNRNGQKLKEKLTKWMEQDVPPFRVRLQVLCDGISDWEGTNIAINAFQYLNKEIAWEMVVIWETILALTFQKIRAKYPKQIYSDEIVWAVSEMTACAIINTEFDVTWNIGYRQLANHQEHIIQFYKGRKNFSDFLENQLLYFKDRDIRS